LRAVMSGPFRAVFGAALVLVGAGVLVISTAFDASPRAEVVDPNEAVNAGAADAGDLSAHNSPALVRSPANPRHLAIANRIDAPDVSCALHSSVDGGASWRQVPIPVPGGEEKQEPRCHAPDVAFGADGTLYLSFVALRGSNDVPRGVWIARSSDGGRTLSAPRRALEARGFQARLVADATVPGRLYLSYVQAPGSEEGFTGVGRAVYVRRSDDGGTSWRPAVRVSADSRARVLGPSLAVGPGRGLSVLYLDLADERLDDERDQDGRGGIAAPQGPWRLVLARSSDGGASWKESVVAQRVTPTAPLRAFVAPFPSLAVDPGRGRVYVAFEDGRLGDSDVWLWASQDGGASWREAVRVNDTPRGDGRSQYRPRLAVAPDGRLDVVYYDRRADPKDHMNEVSLQSSFDGGRSFGARLGLSDRAFDSRVGVGPEGGRADLGSRLGLVSDDGGALAVWSDTRAGTPASRKQDIASAGVAISRPAGLSWPVRWALRLGGLALVIGGLVIVGLWLAGQGWVGRVGGLRARRLWSGIVRR
jgi:hypothetical protein